MVFVFCCRGIFALQRHCVKRSLLHHLQQAGALSGLHHTSDNIWSFFHHTAQDLLSGWPLQKLEKWLFLDTKIRTAAEYTIVWLNAKALWKPGQSFIIAGFTRSLSCSAPCGTGQTTIDTGCEPALMGNCVDHPADCNLFQKCNPVKFPIIRPSTLNYDRKLQDNLFTRCFPVPQRFNFNFHAIAQRLRQ